MAVLLAAGGVSGAPWPLYDGPRDAGVPGGAQPRGSGADLHTGSSATYLRSRG